MTMLVTGATGFVGTHLVNELLSRGNKIRALIRNAGKEEELRQRGVEAVVGDLRDPAAMRNAVSDVKVIFHCAAASSLCGAQEIRETNQEGLRNLLDAARHARCGRIILLSSVNVYGIKNLTRASEDTPLRRAKEPHADIKIDGEMIAQEFADEHGLDITILRPGLIYGVGERHLPRLAEAIGRGKFVFIGSRDNIVPLVYVSDMVQAMLLAAEAGQVSRVYNIADGSRTTIGELVDHLAKMLNCPAPTRVLPYIVPWFVCTLFGLLGRKGPINRTALRFLGTSRYIDIQRARDELGFEPKVKLSDGLAATIDWISQESAAKTST